MSASPTTYEVWSHARDQVARCADHPLTVSAVKGLNRLLAGEEPQKALGLHKGWLTAGKIRTRDNALRALRDGVQAELVAHSVGRRITKRGIILAVGQHISAYRITWRADVYAKAMPAEYHGTLFEHLYRAFSACGEEPPSSYGQLRDILEA